MLKLDMRARRALDAKRWPPRFQHEIVEELLCRDDPGAFSTPWHQTLNWELLPAEEVVAYVCENNKAEHLIGK